MKLFKKLLIVSFTAFLCVNSLTIIDVEAEDSVSAFVSRFYTVCLNRTPDKSGKEYWVSQLKSGVKTGADVASGFLLSKEMYNKDLDESQFVDVLYKSIMGRNESTSEKAYWIKYLQNHSRSAAVKGFIDSKEFSSLCNKYKIKKGTVSAKTSAYNLSIFNDRITFQCTSKLKEFFERNYKEVLGRKAESSGLNYWVDQVSSGKQMIGQAAATGFLHSAEFLGMNADNSKYKGSYKTNKDFITILYKAYLGRDPESGGFNYWHNKLKNGEMTRDEIIAGFANSTEFKNIIKTFANDTSCKVGTTTNLSNVAVTSVKINYPSKVLTLTSKNTYKLSVTVSPSNANENLTYRSLKDNVASVDKNGVITPKEDGTTSVIVTSSNGKTDYIRVVVDFRAPESQQFMNNLDKVEESMYKYLRLYIEKYPVGDKNKIHYKTNHKRLDGFNKIRVQEITTDFSHNQAQIKAAKLKVGFVDEFEFHRIGENIAFTEIPNSEFSKYSYDALAERIVEQFHKSTSHWVSIADTDNDYIDIDFTIVKHDKYITIYTIISIIEEFH